MESKERVQEKAEGWEAHALFDAERGRRHPSDKIGSSGSNALKCPSRPFSQICSPLASSAHK